MAEPLTAVEYVDAYDTTTGDKLPHQVPRTWVDGPGFPHLSATPRQKVAEKAQGKPRPPKSADKSALVKWATTDAPDPIRLSKDAAEAMSADAINDYYDNAQEG